MMAEPPWLAAEPTARAKLTAIMAAVRRCHEECGNRQSHPTGPHMTTSMAEVFIGQLLIRAAASERERIRELAERMGAGYYDLSGGGIHPATYAPFADLLREES
jgi:hypothetical protein